MTDNEIRIAIAEKCGKKWFWDGKDLWIAADDLPAQARAVKCPDYPNDLNAMHSAAFELTVGSLEEPGEYEKYCKWVKIITGEDGIDATARQRAEAFCRTLGMWKE